MIGNNNTPHEDVLLCACAHPHVSLRYNRFSHKWVTIDSHKGTTMQPLRWILWRSDWKGSLNAGSRLCRGLRNYRTMQHHSFLDALASLDLKLSVSESVRTPQLVCILCTLKTKPNVRSILVINIPKPNGCLDRSASRANHCEYQPNQTSDSLFSIWIWHTTILYNSRRPMLR